METLEPAGRRTAILPGTFLMPYYSRKKAFRIMSFEETAQTFLKTHAGVRQQLEAAPRSDTAFANSAAAQLDFIYKQSPYYEPHTCCIPCTGWSGNCDRI
jgi:hypothetical protein